MKIAIRDHQNKAQGLAKAIAEAGYSFNPIDPDILLIDHDAPEFYQKAINYYTDAKVLLYPHGALAYFAWAGLWEINPRTDGFLATSWGMAEAMRAYGYPKPIYVTGWHWCQQKPYNWRDPKRILFAPVHPLANGWLWSEIEKRSAWAFDELLKTGCEITVRYVGSLEANGLWKVNGVKYEQAAMDNSVASIDNADLVVSFGTFAYLAIARGVPTVMYCQDVPLWDGRSEEDIRFVKDWDRLAPLVEYPYDLEWYEIGDEMSTQEVLMWRKQHIGEQITPERIKGIIECLSTPT